LSGDKRLEKNLVGNVENLGAGSYTSSWSHCYLTGRDEGQNG
jgi:hypothetical protein